MESMHICQSCSMPLDNRHLMGTEKDGSLNTDYCIYCYSSGRFTDPDITLAEMKVLVKDKMEQLHITQPVIDMTVRNLADLKRWRSIVNIM